jgi:ParB family transcriptional regulator, chromosome partitioning protein
MGPQDSPRRLGRGLDALLARRDAPRDDTRSSGDSTDAPPAPPSALRSIPLNQIRPNPYQPRKEFRAEELADLESSLRVSGLLQPITVRPAPTGNGFELIAGERRFRAAGRLGWTEIPAIVRETDERTLLTLAMIENLQRSDLDPIEEADGYQRLIDEFSLSQQEVADVVGKDRSTVANALRLLQLPAGVRRLLQERQLTSGHARALLALTGERAMVDLAREAVANGLSVREVERRVKSVREPKAGASGRSAGHAAGHAAVPRGNAAELRRIEELLKRKLQTGVSIHMEGKERGELRLAFFSPDDLERLIQAIGINLDE